MTGPLDIGSIARDKGSAQASSRVKSEWRMRRLMKRWLLLFWTMSAAAWGDEPRAKIGEKLARQGDEIVVCGQLYHTTTRVVLWTDPGGYDAYRVEPRFAPLEKAPNAEQVPAKQLRPNRYGARTRGLTPQELEQVRGGGWDLPLLARVVDQFVIHFDARGTSRRCFQVLHDQRGLSVHFMLDLDGTIYQTLDAKESASHATIANGRSIGIEIANIGAFGETNLNPLAAWYQKDAGGRIRIVIPESERSPGLEGAAEVLRPCRDAVVTGTVQGQRLQQYDFTDRQYDALARLTATLCTLFPKIRCDYPREASGAVVTHKLENDRLATYQGILGHYHVQTNRVDPGPAFQWDRLIESTRKLLLRSPGS
jgi:N-acetylmuramoyl-L-alanine amidase